MDIQDRGRCRNCGFLGLYCESQDPNRNVSPGILEASELTRENGWFGRAVHPSGMHVGGRPTCAMHHNEIGQEYTVQLQSGDPDKPAINHSSAALAVLTFDRKCKDWTPYREGVSPIEERAEKRLRAFDEERKKWDARMEHSRRQYDKKTQDIRDAADQKTQAIKDASERRFNWMTLCLSLVGLLLALLALGSATPDSLISRFIPKDWFPHKTVESPPISK